jgi:K+-transporting ATPase KdpF subunit
MHLFAWLQKPYPMIETISNKLVLALSFGLFIYLFLALFQPFGIQDIASTQPLYIMGFAFVTILFMSINYILFPILFPKWFHKEKWSVNRELLFILFNIFCIAFGNYYYHLISVDDPIHLFELSSFLFMTIAVGVFPVIFLIFTTELIRSKQLIKEAKVINKKRAVEKSKIEIPVSTKIQLKGETTNNYLELEIKQLLFAQSEGNYSKIHYQENGLLQTKLLRISLKNLETQLEQNSSILRCHRSFIINKNNIAHLSGNARSCYIHFSNSTLTVPVSRSFSKEKLI